jgi:hypothetical protein
MIVKDMCWRKNRNSLAARKGVSIMTIKYLEKCGEVCQRRVGISLLTIMGIGSLAALFFVLIGL